jgi:hypothetical protein
METIIALIAIATWSLAAAAARKRCAGARHYNDSDRVAGRRRVDA